MRMQKTLAAATVIAAASALPVLAAETIYVSGANVCGGNVHTNNWRISLQDNGTALFTVYQQQLGSSRVMVREFQGQPQGESYLLTQKGHPWASVKIDNDKVVGRWNNGNGVADVNCDPFSLAKVSDPRTRFDEILGIYEVEEPSVEDAVRVAALAKFLPHVELLPELDQRSYQNRISGAYGKFWSRFFEIELKRKKDASLETPKDREKYLEEIRQMTDSNFGPEGGIANSGATKRFSVALLKAGADRLADTDSPMQPLPLSRETCNAIESYGYSGYEELDLIAGLPTEYWTRNYAEQLLEVARECDGSFTKALVNLYPTIEDNQRQVAWARSERQRLLDVPLELAAFKEANWLLVDEDRTRENKISREMVERFLGNGLSARRAAQVDAAIVEIKEEVESKNLIQDGFKILADYCERKLGEKPWNVDDLDPLFEGCEATVEAHKASQGEKVLADRIAEIRGAPKSLQGVRDADWFRLNDGLEGWYPSREMQQSYLSQALPLLQDALVVARKEVDEYYDGLAANVDLNAEIEDKCEGVPSDLEFNEIRNACRVGIEKVSAAYEVAQCDADVKASGASDELLNSAIEQTGSSAGKVWVKDLICGAAERDLKVTFSSSGMLWWGENHVEIGDDKRAFSGKIEMDDASGLLKVSEIKSIRGDDKLDKLATDKFFACLGGADTCY